VGDVRVAQQFINRDPGVRKADQKPAATGLGEPRQGTHLSMLRTTHPHGSEGASNPDSRDYRGFSRSPTPVSRDYPAFSARETLVSRDYPRFCTSSTPVSRDYRVKATW